MSAILGWEAINKKLNDRSRKGDMFLRLKADEEVLVAFVGEPCMTEVIWIDGSVEPFDPAVHKDKKPSQKFSINVFLAKDDQVSIFESGVGFYEELNRARSQNDFERSLFRLKRTGEGTKTRYTIECVSVLTETVRKRIAELPKHDLGARAQNASKFISHAAAPTWNDNVQDTFMSDFGNDKIPF